MLQRHCSRKQSGNTNGACNMGQLRKWSPVSFQSKKTCCKKSQQPLFFSVLLYFPLVLILQLQYGIHSKIGLCPCLPSVNTCCECPGLIPRVTWSVCWREEVGDGTGKGFFEGRVRRKGSDVNGDSGPEAWDGLHNPYEDRGHKWEAGELAAL